MVKKEKKKNLPPTWATTTLGEILPIEYGKSLPKDSRDGTGKVPVYGSSGQIGWHSKPLTKEPTLIIGRKGNVGAVYYSDVPCWVIDTAYYFELNTPNLNLSYFYYLLQSLNLSRLEKSTTVPGLNRDDYSSLRIYVASLTEQQIIVSEIEKQFSRINEATTIFKSLEINLEQLRLSILKQAFEGKLLTLETTLQQPKESQDNQIYKLQNSVASLPKLPKTWIWTTAEQIANIIDPQPSHRTPVREPNGIPYIGIGDANSDGTIDFSKARKVSKTVLAEHKQRYQLQAGDFIFGKIGTVGNPVQLPEPFDYTLSANVILFQPQKMIIDPIFLFRYMQSPFALSLIKKGLRATTQAAFGIQRIRSFPVPLPPLVEQQKIVAQLESKLKTINNLKDLFNISIKNAEDLRQSILKQAFTGGLVPPIKNTEPASVLLEKITIEKQLRNQEAMEKKESAVVSNKKPPQSLQKDKKIDKRDVLKVFPKSQKELTIEEVFNRAGYKFTVNEDGEYEDVNNFFDQVSDLLQKSVLVLEQHKNYTTLRRNNQ